MGSNESAAGVGGDKKPHSKEECAKEEADKRNWVSYGGH